MPIHNEVAVGRLLVLAYPRLDQGSVSHRWKSKGNVLSHPLQRCWAHHTFSIGWIKSNAARVVGYLESPPIRAGNAIEKSPGMIAPHWKVRISKSKPPVLGRGSKEENILLGRPYHVA